MRDAYGAPASFYSERAAEAAEFINEEMRNFNPYHIQSTAPVLFANAVMQFGVEACDGLEFWIH